MHNCLLIVNFIKFLWWIIFLILIFLCRIKLNCGYWHFSLLVAWFWNVGCVLECMLCLLQFGIWRTWTLDTDLNGRYWVEPKASTQSLANAGFVCWKSFSSCSIQMMLLWILGMKSLFLVSTKRSTCCQKPKPKDGVQEQVGVF